MWGKKFYMAMDQYKPSQSKQPHSRVWGHMALSAMMVECEWRVYLFIYNQIRKLSFPRA